MKGTEGKGAEREGRGGAIAGRAEAKRALDRRTQEVRNGGSESGRGMRWCWRSGTTH